MLTPPPPFSPSLPRPARPSWVPAAAPRPARCPRAVGGRAPWPGSRAEPRPGSARPPPPPPAAARPRREACGGSTPTTLQESKCECPRGVSWGVGRAVDRSRWPVDPWHSVWLLLLRSACLLVFFEKDLIEAVRMHLLHSLVPFLQAFTFYFGLLGSPDFRNGSKIGNP